MTGGCWLLDLRTDESIDFGSQTTYKFSNVLQALRIAA